MGSQGVGHDWVTFTSSIKSPPGVKKKKGGGEVTLLLFDEDGTGFYLFIFGCAVSLWLFRLSYRCSVWASHCSGVSCCGPRALGCADFSSCSTWAQQVQLPGSRAQAQWLWHRLSCSMAYGIFQTQGGTCVSWIDRQSLYHWAKKARDDTSNFVLWDHYCFDTKIKGIIRNENFRPISLMNTDAKTYQNTF